MSRQTLGNISIISQSDSDFLDDLERRLAAAEQKYQEADLEEKLTQLEEAKQRQVIMEVSKTVLKNHCPDPF